MHGLGGDSIETWRHPNSNAFWLRDFLPRQIPDARILTFGHNATAAFGQSTSDVIDHAKGLLTSLVDKREEPEVHIGQNLPCHLKYPSDLLVITSNACGYNIRPWWE